MAASVKDVAALAGLSVGTVSNVLNRPEKVSEKTRERVNQAIAQLGFVRNDAARQLKAGRSRCIGLVVLDSANPFFSDLGRAAETRAAASGLSVLVGNSAHDPRRELDYLSLFEQQRVRGVLLSPVGRPPTSVTHMQRRGIGVVLVDRRDEEDGLSSVSVDDERGGMLALQHLVDAGRRTLHFVGGPHDLRQSVDRLAGARAVAQASGLSLTVDPRSALTIEEGRAAADRLATLPPAQRPDGVFAANDLLAIGLLQGFTLHNMRVPEDVAIIGYDDIEFAAGAAVPLSSIHQPRATMGETAMDILLQETATAGMAARHVVLQPTLVVRRSSGQR